MSVKRLFIAAIAVFAVYSAYSAGTNAIAGVQHAMITSSSSVLVK